MTNDKKLFSYTHEHFIAYPTIILFLLGFSLISFAIRLRLVGNYSGMYTIPISILGTYTLFPVIHDGSHRTISSNLLCNEIISYVAGVPFFFAPFPTWRFIHLRHHHFTNIPEKDPDYYAGGGIENKLYLPVRWVTHILHYYMFAVKELCTSLYKNIKKKLRKNRSCELENLRNITNDHRIQSSGRILIVTITSILINILISIYAFKNNFLYDIVILWIIPSAISITILSILFDYLPHRYYETDIRESKYKITNMTHGLFNTTGKINTYIALLTCNQLTYHNIHHLYPKVPFYKYPQIWAAERDQLIRLGTNVQSIF